MGVWLALYGFISLVFYFLVRRRYQASVKSFHAMMENERHNMEKIHAYCLGALLRWGVEYGRSLDSAVDLTLRHAEALIDHYGHRLRRRIAGPALLEATKSIADCLFLKLPESRGELSDAATEHKHSFAHYIWPRADEMRARRRLAQYRAAWQRSPWPSATSAASSPFPSSPTDVADRHLLRRPSSPTWSRAGWPRACGTPMPRWWPRPSPSQKDLAELTPPRRAARSIAEQLEAARGLVEGRVS